MTGKIIDVSFPWGSNRPVLSLEINEVGLLKGLYNDLGKCELLNINIKKHRPKRSLDANAYAWVLMTKIAEILDSGKDEIYEEMLQKYGSFCEDENGYIAVTVKKSVDMSKIKGHWKFYKGNGDFSSYLMIKGSSEYDTKEMGNFIDRIIEEAKALGIETMTPQEVERMMSEYEKKHNAG